MSKMVNTSEVVYCEREKLNVLGAQGGDDIKAGRVQSIVATNFNLHFLILPVMCRIHIVRDM